MERVGEALLDDIKWELKLKNSNFFAILRKINLKPNEKRGIIVMK
ncbi:hypothetical protein [Bacillus altitudinis]